MRRLVAAALPLSRGIVLDPFMGSGSTVAAATALGYRSIGLERSNDYFRLAEKAVPLLAAIKMEDPLRGRKTNSRRPRRESPRRVG